MGNPLSLRIVKILTDQSNPVSLVFLASKTSAFIQDIEAAIELLMGENIIEKTTGNEVSLTKEAREPAPRMTVKEIKRAIAS